MKNKIPALKIPTHHPKALKDNINSYKGEVRPDWWGAFSMYSKPEYQFLELRFNLTLQVEFAFNGIDFSEPYPIDTILGKVMGMRSKQTRFNKTGLTEQEVETIKTALDSYFFIQEDAINLTFTPKEDTLNAVTVNRSAPSEVKPTIPQEEEDKEDDYGF